MFPQFYTEAHQVEVDASAMVEMQEAVVAVPQAPSQESAAVVEKQAGSFDASLDVPITTERNIITVSLICY